MLKVDFTLITPDGQRKIGFSLEKDSNGTNTTWTISFTLYEMQAGATTFGDPIISLNVVVSPALSGNAQTVAQNGLTAPQADSCHRSRCRCSEGSCKRYGFASCRR